MRSQLSIRVSWVYGVLLGAHRPADRGLGGCSTDQSLASGTLDPGFGKGGRVITTVGSPASGARAVLIQPDGKIVAAGFPAIAAGLRWCATRATGRSTRRSDCTAESPLCWNPPTRGAAPAQPGRSPGSATGRSSPPTAYDSIALARDGRTGRLDSGFGSGGIVKTKFSDSETESVGASDVVLQPDGKIVAVGEHLSSEGLTLHQDFALVRYRADGTLDSSFGIGGKVTTAINAGARAVALQQDGKIVVTGSSNSDPQAITIARYKKDGSLIRPSARAEPSRSGAAQSAVQRRSWFSEAARSSSWALPG